MAKQLAVVLTSGGLDSAVAAALTGQDSGLALLHFHYGQQSAEPELRAFEAMCDFFDPLHRATVSLGDWRSLSDSPLVAPRRDIEDAGAVGKALASTFVPMLAPTMLCAATAWAYTIRAQRVVWGASLDNPGNYPDRADAVRLLTWQLASRCLPDGRSITIDAPLAQYAKPAVVSLALELKVPIGKTWSCLRAGPDPCGHCIGCATRAAAVHALSVKA